MDGGAAPSERTTMSCPVILGPACEQADGGSDEGGATLSVPNAAVPASELETLIALQAMNSMVSNSIPVPAHPTLQPRNLCLFFDGTGNAAFFDQVRRPFMLIRRAMLRKRQTLV